MERNPRDTRPLAHEVEAKKARIEEGKKQRRWLAADIFQRAVERLKKIVGRK